MRIAVFGLGSAGRRHARLLRQLGHEVVGYDPVAEAPREVALAPSEWDALDGADAAVVASPNAFHAAQARAAIRARRPVLVEKPLATSVSDAEAVATEAASGGVVCAVGMNLRFMPAVIELKRLVDEGVLGPISLARASFGYDLRRWRPNTDYRRAYSARADLGGGIVLDAIHELDLLLWLLGPVKSVSAEVDRLSNLEIDVEDTAVGCLRFARGTLASIDLNFHEPAYRRECMLIGSRATTMWEWRHGNVVIRAEGQPDRVIEASSDPEPAYREELVDFLDAAKRGDKPRATAAEGADALRVAEALKHSAHTGARIMVGSDASPRSLSTGH